jgi:flagellar motor protein MotB
MKNIRTIILLPLAAALIFQACVPQHKAAVTKKKLSQQDSLLQEYNTQLVILDNKRQNKEKLNELDDTANSRIQQFIEKTKTEINQLHQENTVLIGTVEVNKEDWEKLRKNLSTCLNATKRINGKILFLSDLINRNTVLRLDQDVLFAPGKYIVEASVINSIGKIFEPVAREIQSFTEKYPEFPLSLAITAKGYADATDIAEGTPLYKELKSNIEFTGQQVSRETLNKELSNLRAKSVIELFQNYTSKQTSQGGIIFIHKGKGEELPDPAITDYRSDDKRRRVVLLYWSVFPDY